MYVKTVMDAFDGRTVEGQRYFHHAGDVMLPDFMEVKRRGGVIKAGVPLEIDLIGEWTLPNDAGRGAWLVQVKYTTRPASAQDIQTFLAQSAGTSTEKQYAQVIHWYVSKGGYSTEAIHALQEAQIFYSDRAAFNALANLFHFHGLPSQPE